MTWSVVTGANRGIGLALCTALKKRGASVVAACRTSSPALDALGVETVMGVDVGTDAGVDKLRDALLGRKVELLINNAGILLWGEDLGKLDAEGIRRQFEVNALGPLRVTQALLDNLDPGAKVAFITSRMGSIADNSSGGHYGYRMSKAALNMAAVSLSRDLAHKQIAIAILHPGMVSTDMIGHRGQIEPDEAARGIIERIDALTLERSGGFWHQNGQELPW
jgi:NAD(P)-dependent dehydrogenase (short-subunit alcohol dehydrogenase family)